jgi:hypothetical protein
MVAKGYVSDKERASGSRAAQRARGVVQLPVPIRKGFVGPAVCAAGGGVYTTGQMIGKGRRLGMLQEIPRNDYPELIKPVID